ncbi:glucosaminidase domain-containing protein [Streptococcus moroccensis]|uniref:Flagellum-specific peptidoglycan hydrolase FlgJ n=1 Tax=Streptococcus moroccensis TaxID=1451356 RepID=A0ABT9YPW2_9STRE|nr:glucosaminidase domain-containing protein [Streptococcus moroccensis]MDQ0221764.1 flagellum-specific peptidoglycan hydrolase FlgJ [Streptococcus moroccensis]
MTKGTQKWMMAGLALSGMIAGLFGNPFSESENNTVEAEGLTGDATVNFINLVGERARQIAQERDLYASVMIAQAILESHSGQSGLALGPSYNLYGIKGSYYGNSVTMKTWEDDGFGNPYYIDAPFRAYNSWAESMYDYANLLSTDFYAGARKSYAPNYWDATAALTGTYATDTTYNLKLNSIIEAYGLTVYDQPAYGYLPGADESVWNHYRGQYTSAQILAEDQAWATYTNSGYGY